MCLPKPKMPSVTAATKPQVAAYDNTEAIKSADVEARIRRRRAGPAADVLTSPLGIPSGSSSTLGGTV